MDTFVKLENITKIYHMGEVEIRAVDGIDFSIQKGEFVVIVGPSGAGKTTVLNILGGMDTASGGRITVDGQDITKYSERQLTGYRRDDIGFVFQFYNLIPNLTALENVQLKNNLTGYKKKKEILAFFEKLGLSDKLNVKTGKLSFGQQQRVAFIRALCQPFDFLFLDEPISHLDDDNSRIMGELIIGEAEKQQAGVIATSIGKHIELPYQRILQL